MRLTRLHSVLAEALNNPVALIYPPARPPGSEVASPVNGMFGLQRAQTDIALNTSTDMTGQLKITPKTLKKCLQAIKEYNFSYSVLTPQANLLSSGTALNNMYSKKIGIASMQKLCVFDQVVFGRSSDQIKEFMMSTYPRQWKVAVFYRRMLQIYDQISGQ